MDIFGLILLIVVLLLLEDGMGVETVLQMEVVMHE
jgi:hypothetical protein